MTRLFLGCALVILLASCTPAPTPAPTPAMVLGGRELHLPFAPAASHKWQRTGYGRPYGAIGKDPELNGRGMWSYSWAMGNCTREVPMVFSDNEMPPIDAIRRCAAASEVLLAFNEPEWASQANMTPDVAAKTLRYLESVWPGELYCCGNLVANYGWFDHMMSAYQEAYGGTPKLAGVHIHIYVAGGIPPIDAPDDGRWLAQSQTNYKRYLEVMRRWGVPEKVIVSECCLLGKHPEGVYLKVQHQYMTWLRSEPAVKTVAWFSARYAGFPHANLLQQGGGLTAIGRQWLDWRWK